MKMLFFPGREAVEAARREGEPLLLLVSVDGETAVAAPADEAVEHHILLDRAGFAAISEALGIMRIFVGIRLRGAEAF